MSCKQRKQARSKRNYNGLRNRPAAGKQEGKSFEKGYLYLVWF